MRYETKTLPAVPASADEAQKFRDAGYSELRSGGTLVFQRRADADDDARAELADRVGPRAADALTGHGYASISAAQVALAASPEDFAALPGIGPATIAKLTA